MMDADHLAIVGDASVGGTNGRADLAHVLEDVREAYSRYVGFASQAQPVALTLWTAHTHAIEAADCTPYVRIFSPEKSSGKTRTEEVAFHLVRSGIRASSITASALFRLIDAHHPTLLVDEVDAIFAPKSEQEDLRSILNAGYERGNPVYRSVAVGKQWDANAYDSFCPKMLAGLENGKLPDTIVSRSIPIGLQRKRKGEPSISKFRKRTDPPRLHELRSALEAWATEDAIALLGAAYPEPADGLTDRQDDIWEPLLAIADLAGGDWPTLARAAAVELHSGDTENESYGVLLLADIRDVLEEPIATFDLAVQLVKRGDRGPWADWWGKLVESDSDASRKSVGHQVARHLKRYGIKPKQVTVDGKNVRGFTAEDFADAFERYLPPLPLPQNARTLDRRSEALSAPAAEDADTPSDQASSVLAFQVEGNGHVDIDRTELARIVRETLAAHAGAGSPKTAAAFELNTLGIELPPGRAVWTATVIDHVLNGGAA
jgi:Protein of unknown function (DUF3631)